MGAGLWQPALAERGNRCKSEEVIGDMNDRVRAQRAAGRERDGKAGQVRPRRNWTCPHGTAPWKAPRRRKRATNVDRRRGRLGGWARGT